MKKRLLSLFLVLTVIFSAPLSVGAHSGRTDSSGGHRDNKNKSGLGSYHYHCGGYPAHLHTNGVCPYSAPKKTTTPNTKSTTTTQPKQTTPSVTPQKTVAPPTTQPSQPAPVIPIKVKVDDKNIQMPTNPITKDGRILVPLRAIFEAMGATVVWDATTKTITGTTTTKEIKLIIDNPIATVNGQTITLDTPATVINGNTFVPVRFIAESLGAKVDWDETTKTVIIKSAPAIPTYKVVQVIDGNTIIIDMNGLEQSIRFIGIDALENISSDVQKGKETHDFISQRLEGQSVRIELDLQEKDDYGNSLAYVYLGNKMFNKTLLEEGYSKVAIYPPNVKYAEEFKGLEQQAKAKNKGLWNTSTTTPIK